MDFLTEKFRNCEELKKLERHDAFTLIIVLI